MSSFEDLVKKYVDEVSDFVPLSTVVSFILGVSLLAHSDDGSGGNGVISALSRNFEDFWFFGDSILQLEIWKILLVVGFGLAGPILAKNVSKKLVARGVRSIRSEIKKNLVAHVLLLNPMLFRLT